MAEDITLVCIVAVQFENILAHNRRIKNRTRLDMEHLFEIFGLNGVVARKFNAL